MFAFLRYQNLYLDFDRSTIPNYYKSIEITVLGHFEVFNQEVFKFVKLCSRSVFKDWLEAAISASQRIFLARNCKEWCTN